MIDVDRRNSQTLTSHSAALRRLSLRASAKTSSPSTGLAGIHSFTSLAESLLKKLTSANVSLSPALSPSELNRIESEFSFTFPPDLRALLSLALPSSPGFPNWSTITSAALFLDLPIAAISLQIARNTFWPKSWGPRPADSAVALKHARLALKRAPLLVPIFHRCYIPCLPCIAGNPVFFVDDDQVSLCGFDLSDFFSRFLNLDINVRCNSLPRGVGSFAKRNPRWVEFWSDAAACDRKRRSSASTSDPERFVEIRMVKLPKWVREYLDGIGDVLKSGGWEESEVNEMVEVAASRSSEFGEVAVDGQAVLDGLLVKVDRCVDSLRRGGWSSDEVSDLLGFDFRVRKRLEVKLPPEIRVKIGKLAKVISS